MIGMYSLQCMAMARWDVAKIIEVTGAGLG